MNEKVIWTIGHSTLAIEKFIDILDSFEIKCVADIRRYPGSRRLPHFNKEALQKSLLDHNIQYEHLESLGGRRNPKPDSKNTGWRVAAFRGYADYMQTQAFKDGISNLQELAAQHRTVYMCSEAVWWSCHRSLVSDFLKHQEWNVQHIQAVGKSQEHPYTSPARIRNGALTYTQDSSLDL
jgi:uncharacterized protein (DUF488 family)